ncbi:fimbrin [Boletus coccyginus]|nr:fimbrin [Boletus coccyginus]
MAIFWKEALASSNHASFHGDGLIEVIDWVSFSCQLTQTRASVLPTRAGKVTVKGSNANVSHTINEDERKEFTNHINGVRRHTLQLFDECRDGLILCKFLNDSVPDTIDTRVLNIPSARKPLNAFQITENNNIVITSANLKGIGCSVVNIGSSDISDGREHLILGLLAQVDIKLHPELYRLCEEGETVDDLLRLTPDQILLRWFNYHLKAAGWKRRVNNFSRDVSDGENYTILLNQLKPDECSRAPLQTRDLRQRAEQVLQNAAAIGCRKYLTPSSRVAGNPRLNLAFVANLFNTWPGLDPLDEQEAKDYGAVEDFDAEGEREARVFTLWLNSLGVEPGVFNLFENIKDGLVILQAFDKILPGSVVWRRVSKPKGDAQTPRQSLDGAEEQEDIGITPNQSSKQVENTNYAVELGKQNGMHLVGIQGADIVDVARTLVLGLVWQLMRMNITKTLMSLSGSGRPITDQEMLKWANTTENGEYEDRRQNAKLAISIARKMNALIFLVPEDIVDVRPRLILTFIGSLMSIAHQGAWRG